MTENLKGTEKYRAEKGERAIETQCEHDKGNRVLQNGRQIENEKMQRER